MSEPEGPHGGAFRGRLSPAVAAVRLAVRRGISGIESGSLVLVACSGGADSLALASALAFEAPRRGLRAGGITVDHGLHPESAQVAGRVAAGLREMGLDPVHIVRVAVAARGAAPGYPGPEGAAREARYAALGAAAVECRAAAVLLGHTLDDQAETVLLGLARGSGPRALGGMPEASGCYLRPLLGVRRQQTREACAALGLRPWEDPANADPAFARTRVRQRVLPLMEELLGPGVTQALARTASQLRSDAAALDELADTKAALLMRDWAGAAGDGGHALDVATLAGLAPALRTRVLRKAAIAAGSPAGSLTAGHVAGLDALVTSWHGQKWADLPGGVRCVRSCGRLHFTTGS